MSVAHATASTPLWGIAAAIAWHGLVHAAHLVDGALTRRELRRRRPAQPTVNPSTGKDTAQ